MVAQPALLRQKTAQVTSATMRSTSQAAAAAALKAACVGMCAQRAVKNRATSDIHAFSGQASSSRMVMMPLD
eukprot:1553003-Pleurochrysis_carterae.AAC.1